ncbi:MAG: ATP-binding protein [Desulfobacula sp.]|jgi:two-component system cell cycle sensor histidine kinase/response regulator CckA|nr:ATP-binding protein [Desulfobacula sp.]
MFRSINSKFYAIAILMMVSFSIGYGLLIYFLNQQSENFISSRDIAIIEKDFNKLNELFYETRFWEKVIFSQRNPEAEMQYGILLEKARAGLSDLNEKELNETTKFNLNQIVEQINQYEINFNQLIQLQTKKKLFNTRMETNYRSMTSIILISNDPKLLKPMFNLTHFLITYRSAITLHKFQALNLVIDSFEKTINATETLDVRMQGYLNSFKELLSEDYLIELDIIATNKVVESITTQIQDYFKNISSELEMRLKRKIQETKQIKQDLQNIFMFFGISGIFIQLLVLYLFSKNIIRPVRSIALVMQKVQEGNLEARFVNHTKNKDDIVQLGFSFNEMLETLKINNAKVLNYQKVLENKIDEITKQKIETQELTERLHNSQKLEAIGTLAGGIAHDFNNILSAIIGFTELALGSVEKGTEIEDDLQEVYAGGKRAKELVKQILAFARQSDEEIKPVQISIIIKEVLKFIRSSISTTIDIKSDIQSDSLIMGNATQTHQVMMNLFTNAAHAMENSGGILEVILQDIYLEDSSELLNIGLSKGDYIKIKISDTGTGIDPNIINSIFEPYFTTKRVGEGTGMGLAMVYGIVEKYGGKITVDSKLGVGTKFTIYFPITKKRSAISAYKSEKLPSGNENILFIDDEAPIAKMGGRLLEQLGYAVTIRTSSLEALELFRSKPDDFDLIISDMAMPNMSGDTLALEIMKLRPEIPVILCTGFSKRMSDEQQAAQIGIKAVIQKPIVQTDFTKTIRRVLDEI